MGYPEFARRTREVFGVPGSEVVIRYPRESSLGKESLDKIEGGLAPVGWLPYDNERSEPSFLSYLIGTGVKGGGGCDNGPGKVLTSWCNCHSAGNLTARPRSMR